MAIITKGTVEKGTEAQFTLDKAELAADTLVSADAYFADDANWANVILEYKSDVGGQSKRVIFDASQATPTADFLASATARDIFEIQRLVIVDHDGGKFTLDRANLTTAEFDIDLSVNLGTILYTRDFSSPVGKQVYELYNGPYGANYRELNFDNTAGGATDTRTYNNIGAFSVATPSGPSYFLRIHVQSSSLASTSMDCYLNATAVNISAATLNAAVGSYIEVVCPVDDPTTFLQVGLVGVGTGTIRISKIEVGYV